MTIYLESSAGAKLLIAEAESPALQKYLDRQRGESHGLVSSLLLETELRRLAQRVQVDQGRVTELMARLDVLLPDPTVYRIAGLLTGANLRSLDALHVAAALRTGADAMLTYDVRQAAAARAAGMQVMAPI